MLSACGKPQCHLVAMGDHRRLCNHCLDAAKLVSTSKHYCFVVVLVTNGFATAKGFLDAKFALLMSKHANCNLWLQYCLVACRKLSFQMPMACTGIASKDANWNSRQGDI